MARFGPLDSAGAEFAFFLALSLVPFAGISIALVSRLLPLDLGASIGKVLRDVLPAESHVSDEVLRWARSSPRLVCPDGFETMIGSPISRD